MTPPVNTTQGGAASPTPDATTPGRVELPGGYNLRRYTHGLNGPFWVLSDPANNRLADLGDRDARAFAAALTPSPSAGMEEILALLTIFGNARYTGGEMGSDEPEAEEEELEKALDARAKLLSAFSALLTRAETAEAQVDEHDHAIAGLVSTIADLEATLASLRAERVPAELVALSAKATPGEWSIFCEALMRAVMGDGRCVIGHVDHHSRDPWRADSEFIVAAVNYVRTLTTEPRNV